MSLVERESPGAGARRSREEAGSRWFGVGQSAEPDARRAGSLAAEQALEGRTAKLKRLRELKALGVQLAVDDFGTGFSSLQHLRRFPIDALKIDRSFVEGVGGAPEDSALARVIIDLGGSFRLGVIAEGIETTAQLSRLVELGCTLGQGFHFARPMTAAALEDALEQGLPTGPPPVREGSAA